MIFILFSCDYKKIQPVISKNGVVNIQNFMEFNPEKFELKDLEKLLELNFRLERNRVIKLFLFFYPSFKDLKLGKNFNASVNLHTLADGKYRLVLTSAIVGSPCKKL